LKPVGDKKQPRAKVRSNAELAQADLPALRLFMAHRRHRGGFEWRAAGAGKGFWLSTRTAGLVVVASRGVAVMGGETVLRGARWWSKA